MPRVSPSGRCRIRLRLLSVIFAASVLHPTSSGVFPTRGSLWAQPVPSRDPASTHIFPAGGRRGSVVKVRVGAECLPPRAKLRLWGTGISAPPVLGEQTTGAYAPSPRRAPTEMPISYPKEWSSEIRIGEDARLGAILWTLTCSQGGTGARPFVVGDLPELIEQENNSRLERAERVQLPVTINGQICGERDLDYFLFSAKAGSVVVCDTLAGRLGSALDPAIEILDSEGRALESEEVRIGSDPVVAFRAPATDDYFLMVSNLSFHGSPKHVYRINVSTAPYVPYAFPPIGRAGDRRKVTFYALSGVSTPRVITETVEFPHLTIGSNSEGHSGEFQYRGNLSTISPVALSVTDLPHVVEAESNDPEPDAMKVHAPVVISGQFLNARDEDWYRFAAEKNKTYSVVCRAHPRGFETLPVVSLVDPDGKVLQEVTSVETSDQVCRLEWRAPASGEYRLRVRDLQYGIRGGPQFIYELVLREARANFALKLTADFLSVVQGEKREVEVKVERYGGLESEIELAFAGLPAGLKAEPLRVATDATSAKLNISVETDARPIDTPVRVVGRATVGASVLEHFATATHWGLGPEGVSVASPAVDYVHLTVRHKPVFRLYCEEAYKYANRGTVYPYAMEIERLGHYDGDIVMQIGDRQNRDLDGIEMFETVLQGSTTSAQMPIYLPETMHINIQSQSQLYVQAYSLFKDQWGQEQSVLVVSEKRCMIRTMPTVAKLRSAAASATVRPETTTLYCPLDLERTTNFDGPLDVELIASTPGFVAESVRFDPGDSSLVVRVEIQGARPRRDSVQLTFRGTGSLKNGRAVISEAKVPIEFVGFADAVASATE